MILFENIPGTGVESSFLFEGFKCINRDYVLLWVLWETKFKLASYRHIFYAISIL